jgi:hypothetical protein
MRARWDDWARRALSRLGPGSRWWFTAWGRGRRHQALRKALLAQAYGTTLGLLVFQNRSTR